MQNETITIPILAGMIDHSLLHPTFTKTDILKGLEISKNTKVATACVKPCDTGLAAEVLRNSETKVCAVVSFPHGNSTTKIKIAECRQCISEGAAEIDIVCNIGKVLSGDWQAVENEISQVNAVVVEEGAILKVIFENDYLENEHIIQLTRICSDIGVAFVKTSTGYGFVKQPDGSYNYRGATDEHLSLMVKHARPGTQVKAAGGIRTLDDLLRVRALGISRVGATATVSILEEAKKRFPEQP